MLEELGMHREIGEAYSDVEKRKKGEVSLKARARTRKGASAHMIEQRIVGT